MSAAQAPNAEGEVVLSLPRPIAAGETVVIAVAIGPVGRGRSLEIATAEGRSLGVISAFGVRTGQDTGTYTVPVPSDAIRDGRLALRLMVRQGDTARAPTPSEVRGIKLSIAGAR